MRTLTKLFANIKNGQRAGKGMIKTPFSKCSIKILNLLFLEGFICGYGLSLRSPQLKKINQPFIYILLKYKDSQPVIKNIKQISSSGCRVYKNVKSLQSHTRASFEFIILSTPKGIISHKTAISLNVGGEVLCKVI
uniref:Ribosomal protein S8 n=1 Tax=Cymbomonas tetramitiformis TaxID=36881 RepID=A0A1S5R1Y7_9CHLO|nr:ribosomal protein S8 [Cymbomonas tetramitiformis]ANA57090.1 ribosomal protein S8 [Cymbomonas tetramitiformis]